MRRRPLRTTERSDPRSTRREIAFRLMPVRSAASVMVYVRTPSPLERRILPNLGRSGNLVPSRGLPAGVAQRGKRGPRRVPRHRRGPRPGSGGSPDVSGGAARFRTLGSRRRKRCLRAWPAWRVGGRSLRRLRRTGRPPRARAGGQGADAVGELDRWGAPPRRGFRLAIVRQEGGGGRSTKTAEVWHHGRGSGGGGPTIGGTP